MSHRAIIVDFCAHDIILFNSAGEQSKADEPQPEVNFISLLSFLGVMLKFHVEKVLWLKLIMVHRVSSRVNSAEND